MPRTAFKVLPSERLSLKDRLSRLTFVEACQLLGSQGRELIQRGANEWTVNIPDDVYLGEDLLRVSFPVRAGESPVIVTITLMAESRKRLHFRCDHCPTVCDHIGAVFSLVLEEKTALGLAAPPRERKPVASLGEDDLVQRAFAERAERARQEPMTVKAADAGRPWTDYVVTNQLSGKTYRVALRGLEPGESYCSCPDFRTNTLGTCKHVLHSRCRGEAALSSPVQLRRTLSPARNWRSTCVMPAMSRCGCWFPTGWTKKRPRIVAPLRDGRSRICTTCSNGWPACKSLGTT